MTKKIIQIDGEAIRIERTSTEPPTDELTLEPGGEQIGTITRLAGKYEARRPGRANAFPVLFPTRREAIRQLLSARLAPPATSEETIGSKTVETEPAHEMDHPFGDTAEAAAVYHVDREQLIGEIELAARAIARSSSFAALRNVLIEATPEGLVTRACNGEIAIETALPSEPKLFATGPALAVQPTLALALLRTVEAERVFLGFLPGKLVIQGPDHRDVLIAEALGWDEVPAPPKSQTRGTDLALLRDELRDALAHVRTAVSPDMSRPVLGGVFVERPAGSDVARLVATDTHRLHCADLLVQYIDGPDDDVHAIVPPSFLEAVLATGVEQVAITVGDTAVAFETPLRKIAAALIAGKYPDWRRVVPTGGDVADILPSVLVKRIRHVESLAKASSNRCVVYLSQSRSALFAGASEMGEATDDEAWAENATREIRLAVNTRYLREAFQAIGPKAEIFYTEPMRPLLAKSADKLALVMPMALPN